MATRIGHRAASRRTNVRAFLFSVLYTRRERRGHELVERSRPPRFVWRLRLRAAQVRAAERPKVQRIRHPENRVQDVCGVSHLPAAAPAEQLVRA